MTHHLNKYLHYEKSDPALQYSTVQVYTENLGSNSVRGLLSVNLYDLVYKSDMFPLIHDRER